MLLGIAKQLVAFCGNMKIEGKNMEQKQPKKKAKYKNKKVEFDGYVFDSKIEGEYYFHLKQLHESGKFLFFRLQPRYLLMEAFKRDGELIRKIDYVADFEVHHLDGSIETVDVKGMETEAFKIKKKLFLNKYPHKLTLITYSVLDGGWITLKDLAKARKLRKEGKAAGKGNDSRPKKGMDAKRG